MANQPRGGGKTGRRNKDGAGQPTAYKPEYAEQAAALCKLGATDMELADFFKVTWRTIYNWKNTNADFNAALKEGKEAADARVTRSLYQRAVGYEHDSVKIFMPASRKQPVIVPFIEHVAPDVNAATFWLKCRRPDEWREKHTLAIGGDPDGVPIEHGVSALEELFGRIASLAAASGKTSGDEPDDGSAGD